MDARPDAPADPDAELRAMDLLILRHAEKTGSGLCDPLTARGRADALAVAEALAALDVDAVVMSPYRRSQETVAPFLRRSGLTPVIDARLAEWMISPSALAEIFEHGPAVVADRHYRAPWSETAAECWTRVAAALRDLRATGARRPLLACHGGILGIALMHLSDGFRSEDWRTFHQPTLVAVHRGAWRKLPIPGVRA